MYLTQGATQAGSYVICGSSVGPLWVLFGQVSAPLRVKHLHETFAPGFAPLLFHSHNLKFVSHFPFKITDLSTFLSSIKYCYCSKYSKSNLKSGAMEMKT